MPETSPFSRHFTTYIVIAMLAGILFGLFLKWSPIPPVIRDFLVGNAKD